ncbi:hypothetical protein HYX14_04735 [Candidatus Woesearchaeota archaeon]|nr:hypothetical protein [Candidatus Woesearchaeota archaeon]
MDAKARILGENLEEYLELGKLALHEGKFNSAVMLFFKAVCAAVDLFIFEKEGKVPSSHTDRFRIVEQRYPDLYEILDTDFPFYQDTYSKKMTREAVEVLREDAYQIAKRLAGREKR